MTWQGSSDLANTDVLANELAKPDSGTDCLSLLNGVSYRVLREIINTELQTWITDRSEQIDDYCLGKTEISFC